MNMTSHSRYGAGQNVTATAEHSATVRTLQQLQLSVAAALRKLQQPQRSLNELVDAQALLQSLQLPANVVVRASRHFTNAARYLKYGEMGAARWEMQALRSCLTPPRKS